MEEDWIRHKESVRTPYASFLMAILEERDGSKLLGFIFAARRIRLCFFELAVVILSEAESIVSFFFVSLESACLVGFEFPLQRIFLEIIDRVVHGE